MIGRLLCWLGFHNWSRVIKMKSGGFQYVPPLRPLDFKNTPLFCLRCGKQRREE